MAPTRGDGYDHCWARYLIMMKCTSMVLKSFSLHFFLTSFVYRLICPV